MKVRRRDGRAHGAVALITSFSALAGWFPAAAQPSSPSKPVSAPAAAAPSADTDEDEDEAAQAPPAAKPSQVAGVTVVARRPILIQPGAVVGDIKPELQLSPADIQSYGVSTVTELLNELAPETRSDRGRGGETPVILLNGRRISSFNEVMNIPTEAILRVDILPEEVSLKYGYTADQRVVNIVLRRRFRAITGELVGGGATEGGRVQGEAEGDLFHVRGDTRLNLDLKYQGSSAITDADRGVIEPAPPSPYDAGADLADNRTLSPATQSLTANAVAALPILAGINATLNGTLGATRSDALQGFPTVALTVPAGDPFSTSDAPTTVERYVDQPLRQSIDGWTAHLGSTLNRDLSDWRLSLTDAFDHAETDTTTGVGVDPDPMQDLLDANSPTFDPFGPLPADLIASLPDATARVRTDSGNIQFLANSPLFKLPAGAFYVSAKAGDTQSWLASVSTQFGAPQDINLARNDANAVLNLDLPIASATHHFLGWLGELSVNANATLDALSDYGVLKAFGYGVNWTPIPGYNLIVSHTNDQAAPTMQQLGNPVVETPGVPLFDYATGETVDVTQITGGDRGLTADNRNVTKIGLTLKPLSGQDFTLVANYIRSDIDHAIETFPAADAAIEAAFPDRFIRDADGDLVEEDDRPVNFAKADRAELRWGFNYSRPIGPQPQRRFGGFRRGGAGYAGRRYGGAFGTNGAPGGNGPNPPFPTAAPPDFGPTGPAGTAPPPSTTASGAAPPAEGAGPPPPPAAGFDGGGRGGGFGRGGFGRGGGGFGPGGRLQVAVYHTIYFEDRMLVRPGGPVLDLLNGAAASSTGGQYRNEVEGQLGLTLLGFGARVSLDWRQATYVQGGQGASTGDLFFSDLTTVNLRLFDNLGQQPWMVRRFLWLRGSRVTLNVTNLFDQRIAVHDAYGVTPLSYQPGYIDPVGRTVTLSIRKLFF